MVLPTAQPTSDVGKVLKGVDAQEVDEEEALAAVEVEVEEETAAAILGVGGLGRLLVWFVGVDGSSYDRACSVLFRRALLMFGRSFPCCHKCFSRTRVLAKRAERSDQKMWRCASQESCQAPETLGRPDPTIHEL